MTDYYVTTSGSDSNSGTSEGAAFATLGKAGSVATTSGDNIYVKSGTYDLTTSTVDVAGGKAVIRAGVSVLGYESAIGDNCPTGSRPQLNHAGFIGTGAADPGMISVICPSYADPVVRIKNLYVKGDKSASVTARPRFGIDGSGNHGVVTNSTGFNFHVDNCVIEGFFYGIGSQINTTLGKANLVTNTFFDNNTFTCQYFGKMHRCLVHADLGFECDEVTDTVVVHTGSNAFGTNHDTGFKVAISARGCVVINNGSTTTASGIRAASVNLGNVDMNGCLAIGFNHAYELDFRPAYVTNCFEYDCTNSTNIIGSTEFVSTDITSLTENPFVDSANLDLTLVETLPTQQALGGLTTLQDGLARGLNWYRLPADHNNEQDANYPFRFLASGSFQSDVLQLHPLRENR